MSSKPSSKKPISDDESTTPTSSSTPVSDMPSTADAASAKKALDEQLQRYSRGTPSYVPPILSTSGFTAKAGGAAPQSGADSPASAPDEVEPGDEGGAMAGAPSIQIISSPPNSGAIKEIPFEQEDL